MCKKSRTGVRAPTLPVLKPLKNRITLEKRLFGQGHFCDLSPLFDHLRFFDLHRTCGQSFSSGPPLPFFQECGLCMNIAVDPHLNADLRCLSNPDPYENRSHPFSISLFIHSGRGGLSVTWVLSAGWKEIFICGVARISEGAFTAKGYRLKTQLSFVWINTEFCARKYLLNIARS